jgi:ornithine carrier protein
MQKAFYTEKSPLPMTALVACGAMSGAFTSLLLTPIELVKCKMQVPSINGHKGLGPMSLITTIYRGEGFLGFWHGQFGTLIRETGGSAAWFGTYEAVTATFRSLAKSKALDSNIPLPLWQQMTAGAAAGMGYNFVFYPADTIKSRMQTEEIESGGTKKKFWAAGRSLWRQQGIKGLYRGCGITVGRAAPSSAFIFAIYEALRGWFE